MSGWRIGQGRIDDSINNALYQARATRSTPFGKIIGPVEGRWRSSAGEYVLCNSWGGDVDISLPGPGRDGLGIPITISNLGSNTVYVWPSQGSTIRGHNVWPISRSTPPITFIKVNDSLYDCPGAPSERIWAEWNEMDMSQFDEYEGNSGSPTVTTSVSLGESDAKRPLINMTVATSNTGVVPSQGLIVLKRRLPTKAYRVECDWYLDTLYSSSCDSGPVCRFQSDGSYYSLVLRPSVPSYQVYSSTAGTGGTVGDVVTPQLTSANLSGGSEGASAWIECRGSTTLTFAGPEPYTISNTTANMKPAGRAGFALRANGGTGGSAPKVLIRKFKVVLTNTHADLIP